MRNSDKRFFIVAREKCGMSPSNEHDLTKCYQKQKTNEQFERGELMMKIQQI